MPRFEPARFPSATEAQTEQRESSLVESATRIALHAGQFLALGSVVTALWYTQTTEQPGEYVKEAPTLKQPAPVRNTLTIISLNTAGEEAEVIGPKLHRLDQLYDPTVLALQEVTTSDAKQLGHSFPSKYKVRVKADQYRKWWRGGYNNMLITDMEVQDPETTVLPGTSTMESAARTSAGGLAWLGKNTINTGEAWTEASEGRQETRAAIAGTILVRRPTGGPVGVRIATTHLAGDVISGVHQRQFTELKVFMGTQARNNTPTVICGDFNAGSPETAAMFQDTKFKPIPLDGPTTLSGKKRDQCVFYSAGRLQLKDVEVVDSLTTSTDHHALKVTFSISGGATFTPVESPGDSSKEPLQTASIK